MTSSDLDLAGLREIAEAATPGPWEADGSKYPGPDDALFIVPVGDGGAIAYVQPLWDDAEHIAAFDPPMVLALLDRIEELQAAKSRLDKIRARHLRAGTKAQSVCVHCDVAWPCETIKILDESD